jgi:hypothetical protein
MRSFIYADDALRIPLRHCDNYGFEWGSSHRASSDLRRQFETFVTATLIINLISWPPAIVIAYRVGLVTGVEYFRKARAKVAQHGLRT